MDIMKRFGTVRWFLVAALVLFSSQALAQTYQYAVKFVCGKADGKGLVLTDGVYFTGINVHNPTEKTVAFGKKFAVALPGESTNGTVTRYYRASLRADQAMEIDCKDIEKHGVPLPATGFAVIVSPVELDVVAVYTAQPSANVGVSTMDVETIAPRRLATTVPIPEK
jgi:hypothetical protein